MKKISIDEHIEQLMLDEELQHPSSYVYLDTDILDADSFIACKLDWYTLMIEDHSINEVISWLGLDEAFSDEFFKSTMAKYFSFDDTFFFVYNGVCIQVKKFYLYNELESIKVFDKKLPSIRLDIRGSGLDFLRSQGVNVDDILTDPLYLLPGSHITRCDFAYDFINYKPEIIDQLINYCLTMHTPSGRILIHGLSSALTYSVKLGNEKTVYFGSSQSQQMLRVYDKRLQYIDIEQDVYIKDNPYNNPDSWIRIELQLRKAKAHKMCLSGSDFGGILHFILDYYQFSDTTTPAHRRELWQPWQDFVKSEDLPPIIQNLQYVEKVKTVRERIVGSYDYFVANSLIFDSMFGADSVQQRIIRNNLWLLDLQDFSKPYNEKRFKAFMNKVNQCGIHLQVDPVNQDGLYISSRFNKVLYKISSSTCYNLTSLEDQLASLLQNGVTYSQIKHLM